MSSVSKIFFDFEPPTVFQTNFLSRSTYGQIIHNASTLALSYLSPKQSMRPDTFLENFSEVSTRIGKNLAFHFFRVSSLFVERIPSKLGTDYLSALYALLQFSVENRTLSEEEKKVIEQIFSQIITGEICLEKLDFFVMATQNSRLKKQHNDLKALFNVCNPSFFEAFKDKLQNLSDIPNINEIEALREEEKLTLKDTVILMTVFPLLPLLESLKDNQVQGVEDLYSKLTELDTLTRTPFFQELKQLCARNCASGTVFLGDRRFYQVLNSLDFDCTNIMRQIFMGRICHVGIFVRPEGKVLHMSHVNIVNNGHSVLAIRNPLTLPFFYSLALDITTLFPSSLSAQKQAELKEVFAKEFQALSEEGRPELLLAGNKEHLRTLIFGSKTVYPHPLSQIAYPSAGTPTMCSTYVGITFLKAVQKVNEVLEKQGFKERILHPFGEYEDVMNMDILRLLYLLKQLKVIKPAPMNETLAKVFSSMSTFSVKNAFSP